MRGVRALRAAGSDGRAMPAPGRRRSPPGAVRRTYRRHWRSQISQYGSRRPSSRSSARCLRSRSDASTQTRTARDARAAGGERAASLDDEGATGPDCSSPAGRSRHPVPPPPRADRPRASAAAPACARRLARRRSSPSQPGYDVVEPHERRRTPRPGVDERIGEGRLARAARAVDEHDRLSACRGPPRRSPRPQASRPRHARHRFQHRMEGSPADTAAAMATRRWPTAIASSAARLRRTSTRAPRCAGWRSRIHAPPSPSRACCRAGSRARAARRPCRRAGGDARGRRRRVPAGRARHGTPVVDRTGRRAGAPASAPSTNRAGSRAIWARPSARSVGSTVRKSTTAGRPIASTRVIVASASSIEPSVMRDEPELPVLVPDGARRGAC